MTTTAPGAKPARCEVDALADDLEALLATLRHGRSLGLAVTAPAALVKACRDLIAEADHPTATPPIDTDTVLAQLPLRRAIWHVISAGEQFGVTDVTERLGTRGRPVAAAKVSNALGYWVDRSRLTRLRKGVYHYPGVASPDENHAAPQPTSRDSSSTSRNDTSPLAHSQPPTHGTPARS